MADAGNTDDYGYKEYEKNVIIHNHFQDVTIGNLANQVQDKAIQSCKTNDLSSPASEPPVGEDEELGSGGRIEVALRFPGNLADLTPDDLAHLQRALGLLQQITSDVSWRITGLHEGSIFLLLQGSQEGACKLKQLHESGELPDIFARPIQELKFSNAELLGDTDYIDEDPVKEMLVAAIQAGEANLIKANLIGANLSKTKLHRAQLIGANLSQVELVAADLSEAELLGVSLRGANLTKAKLAGANLRLTNLSETNFTSADLSEANLSGANFGEAILRKAKLSGANLSKANLKGSIIDESTKIGDKWRLVHSLVNGGIARDDLNEVDLSRVNLTGVDLNGISLIRGDLSGAELNEVNFSGADLREANFSGAELRGAEFHKANVEDAIFLDSQGLTNLEKADLQARGAIF